MVFIYEILKIIFLQGSLKNLNFFEKKNSKFLNNHLIVQKWKSNFSDQKNVLLIIYICHHVGPTSLTTQIYL